MHRLQATPGPPSEKNSRLPAEGRKGAVGRHRASDVVRAPDGDGNRKGACGALAWATDALSRFEPPKGQLTATGQGCKTLAASIRLELQAMNRQLTHLELRSRHPLSSILAWASAWTLIHGVDCVDAAHPNSPQHESLN